MTDDVIPEDVKQFFLHAVDSIAQWEGLLLLRADAEKTWEAGALARELYIEERQAVEVLEQLMSNGFVARVGTAYHYQSRNAEVDELVGRAAECYREYLVPVTHIIHAKPKSRVQEFADAFRLRKE